MNNGQRVTHERRNELAKESFLAKSREFLLRPTLRVRIPLAGDEFVAEVHHAQTRIEKVDLALRINELEERHAKALGVDTRGFLGRVRELLHAYELYRAELAVELLTEEALGADLHYTDAPRRQAQRVHAKLLALNLLALGRGESVQPA